MFMECEWLFSGILWWFSGILWWCLLNLYGVFSGILWWFWWLNDDFLASPKVDWPCCVNVKPGWTSPTSWGGTIYKGTYHEISLFCRIKNTMPGILAPSSLLDFCFGEAVPKTNGREIQAPIKTEEEKQKGNLDMSRFSTMCPPPIMFVGL